MPFNKKRHRVPAPPGKPHYHRTDEPGDQQGAPDENNPQQPQAQPAGQGPIRPQGQGQPQGQNRPQGQPQGQGRPQGLGQNRPQGQPQGQNRPQGQGQGQNRPQGQPQGQGRPQGQGQGQNRPQGQPQGQGRPQGQGQGQPSGQGQNRPDLRNRRPDQNRQQPGGWRPQPARPEPRPEPRKIYPPVNLSDEIKDQLGLNGLEASKKIQELEKVEHICPYCDKPIESLVYALKHEPTGGYAHFDCIIGEFQKQKPDLQQKGRKIYYVGSGNFAVVKESFDKRGRFRGYTVLEKLTGLEKPVDEAKE